jgi:TatD DNase family protein
MVHDAGKPYFIDTHAHIQGDEFTDDLDAVIERAHEAGVVQLVLPAVDLATAQSGLALARRYEGLYATAGYHPHEASLLTPAALSATGALLSDERVVAVGEIGLDFYRMHSSVVEQEAALSAQLEVAAKHTLPVIIHCRDAWDAAEPLLGAWARRVASAFAGKPVGVLHYYTHDVETARHYVELGFLISIHTSVTHPKAAQLREVAAALPLESLVIETDSPYGAPQVRRSKRNEPSYVVEAARQIAEARGVSVEEVAIATTANARRLFRLPVPSGNLKVG